MSFGLSAAAVGMIVAGTAVAATVYTSDQARKAANRQKDALLKGRADDARQKVEAETGAAVSANAALAASKRRRKASSLLASPSASSLGGAGSLLGGGNLNQGPQ